MNFFRQWRIRRLQRRIAALKAKDARLCQLYNGAEGKIAGGFVLMLASTPAEIASLETALRQLQGEKP